MSRPQKQEKRERLYQLHVDPADNTLDYLLCRLFSDETATSRALPDLRSDGLFRESIRHDVTHAVIFCLVTHYQGAVQFTFSVTTRGAKQAVNAMVFIDRLFEQTGAVRQTVPVHAYEPLVPGSRDGGKPFRERKLYEQQIRADIPDHPWNRRMLPVLLDSLVHGLPDKVALPGTLEAIRDSMTHIEYTVDSRTGWSHLYFTMQGQALRHVTQTLLEPMLATYLTNAYIHHTDDADIEQWSGRGN